MALPPGTRVGPYEITGTLGVGGMGEVYRARDGRLGRDVALKVLPELFASDPDRRARFEREAQVLAALKHPNIGTIYGLEENALVLELIEGDTLAERTTRGAIPLDEALPMAQQIAEALQAAHDQGVIHRDLKPSNIKLTGEGQVKVLDFGLAKLSESSGPAQASAVNAGALAHLSMSPTITSPAATGLGVILGTAAYMSPEQAKGRPADKRSDVWSFGCVLYEMLTGKRAFDPEDVSDTLALVLKGEPDWNALPPAAPAPVRTLLRACLEKDRRNRIADMSAVLFVLARHAELTSTAFAEDASATGRRPLARRLATAALIMLAATATGTGVWLATRSTSLPPTRFFVTPPDDGQFSTGGRVGTSAAISPDGRTVAFTARTSEGKLMLWVRAIDSLSAQPLAGTDDALFPFWSPDSRFIGYFSQNKLLKIAATGGPSQTVCNVNLGRGGAWSREGQIVFGENTGPLYRVSSAGGMPIAVTRLGDRVQDHRFPSFLPDNRHVLYFVTAPEGIGGVFVVSLDTGETKRVVEADTGAIYDASNKYLLFGRQGTLLAQSFDVTTLSVSGEPFPVAERLESGVYAGIVAFSISDNDGLAYGEGSAFAGGLYLGWFDRRGKALGTFGPPANYRGAELSPDDSKVAVKRRNSQFAVETGDIWITEISRDATSRFTFAPAQSNSSPIWSPDGQRIVFSSLRGNKWGLYAKSANGVGGEEQLLESDAPVAPTSWSPDGRSLVYITIGEKTATDLWLLPLAGDRRPVPFVTSAFNDNRAQISPDGKWVAYDSNESGQSQIYVRPYPTGNSKWQVSTSFQAFFPRWRGDGRELYFMDALGGGTMMAVDIKANGTALEIGTQRALFDSRLANLGGERIPPQAYAVTRDGQRFLIPQPVSITGPAPSNPIAVVLSWSRAVQH